MLWSLDWVSFSHADYRAEGDRRRNLCTVVACSLFLGKLMRIWKIGVRNFRTWVEILNKIQLNEYHGSAKSLTQPLFTESVRKLPVLCFSNLTFECGWRLRLEPLRIEVIPRLADYELSTSTSLFSRVSNVASSQDVLACLHLKEDIHFVVSEASAHTTLWPWLAPLHVKNDKICV